MEGDEIGRNQAHRGSERAQNSRMLSPFSRENRWQSSADDSESWPPGLEPGGHRWQRFACYCYFLFGSQMFTVLGML